MKTDYTKPFLELVKNLQDINLKRSLIQESTFEDPCVINTFFFLMRDLYSIFYQIATEIITGHCSHNYIEQKKLRNFQYSGSALVSYFKKMCVSYASCKTVKRN